MPNKQDKRRLSIFEKYAANLRLLVENRLLPNVKLPDEPTYICPICLRSFTKADLDQKTSPNPLTLEDAPPKSLGGKAAILTCQECNNTCGYTIDCQLLTLLDSKDASEFAPGATFVGNIENNEGIRVKSRIKVNADRSLTITQSPKYDHPARVAGFAQSVTYAPDSRRLTMGIDYKTFDHTLANYAVLKAAYLLMFKELGYTFIFNETLRRLRNQLQDAETEIYPTAGWWDWSRNKYMGSDNSLIFVHDEGMKCFIVSFPLKTAAATHYYSVILPCELHIEYVIKSREDARYHTDFRKLKEFIGVPFSRSHEYTASNCLGFDILNLADIEELIRRIKK